MLAAVKDNERHSTATALAPDEPIDSAQQRLLSFAGNIVPEINRYVPR